MRTLTCRIAARPYPAKVSIMPNDVHKHFEGIHGRMVKLMELVQQANAPEGFGDWIYEGQRQHASPLMKEKRAATVEGQAELDFYRNLPTLRFRFGAAGDYVEATKQGEGIYGLSEKLAQDDARDIRLIAAKLGILSIGEKAADLLARWAREGCAMIFRTTLRDIKDDSAVIRQDPVKWIRQQAWTWYTYEKLARWMQRCQPVMDLMGDIWKASGESGEKMPAIGDPAPQPAPNAPTHSSDFTSVDWFGTRYTFDKGNQALAIEVLWGEFENGQHGLAEKRIGERIGSANEHFRLVHVFRMRTKTKGKGKRKTSYHPAWGAMIQKESAGCYKLVPPKKI